jgi:hypothetical protein
LSEILELSTSIAARVGHTTAGQSITAQDCKAKWSKLCPTTPRLLWFVRPHQLLLHCVTLAGAEFSPVHGLDIFVVDLMVDVYYTLFGTGGDLGPNLNASLHTLSEKSKLYSTMRAVIYMIAKGPALPGQPLTAFLYVKGNPILLAACSKHQGHSLQMHLEQAQDFEQQGNVRLFEGAVKEHTSYPSVYCQELGLEVPFRKSFREEVFQTGDTVSFAVGIKFSGFCALGMRLVARAPALHVAAAGAGAGTRRSAGAGSGALKGPLPGFYDCLSEYNEGSYDAR